MATREFGRRTMIKGAAVAAVAAWTAPVVLDSLTSPAAAASTSPITCSWFYLLFKKPGDSTVYWTGSNANTCNTLSTNNAGTYSKTCSGVTYTIDNGRGVLSWSTGHGSTAATAAGASCSTSIRINGNTVTAIGGAQILAAFSHPSSSLSCSTCPSGSANNSITVCGSSAGGGNCDAPT